MLLALLGAVSVFVAVSCVFLWVAGLRGTPAEARLVRLAPATRPLPIDAPFAERLVVPVLDSVTRGFVQLLPHTFVARISRQLIAAGRPMTTQSFFAMMLITTIFFPAAALVLAIIANGQLSFLAVLLAVVLAGMGFFGPVLWLRRRVRERKLAIWKRLADAFDLITVCVEAGLGLDAALRQVAEKQRGPLAEEISQTLREVGMGRSRREALEDMAQRADVRELATFVNAVIQAESLGTSLARVLRAQAQTLRVRRRQRAEEMSRKAPVKMVFPLVFFLMPTFFIVTLGPVFVRLVNYLKG